MSTEESKAFVRRQIEELWNKGNLDAADECFTSRVRGPRPGQPRGDTRPRRVQAKRRCGSCCLPRFPRANSGSGSGGRTGGDALCDHWHPKGELTGIPRPASGLRLTGWASTTSQEVRLRSRGSTTT